jgi:alpha-tubulin suppressor-like RCC1 family protein
MRRKHLAPAIAGIMLVALGLGACSNTKVTGTTSSTRGAATAPSKVYRWGVVGSGSTTAATKAGLQSDTPKAVTGITGTVIQIATSNSDSYALTSTGAVWAWGAGKLGELGDGHKPDFVTTPVQVHFPAGVIIASLPNPMPFGTALAIDSQGNAWGWGYNRRDELCAAPARTRLQLPIKLPLTDVTLASGAGAHVLFYSHGKVVACGLNTGGELGDGNTKATTTPTAVVGLPAGPVKALVSSWKGSGALMTDGSYYDWGYNHAGQLGNKTTANSSVPVQVSLPAAVTQVAQGGSSGDNGQTLVILSNGSVWAWGNGKWGQLGDDVAESSSAPIQVKVPPGVTFTQVRAGGSTSYAIDRSAHLWSWGQNNNGQLGNGGKKAKEFAPVSIGIVLTEVSSTAANVSGLYKESDG